MEGGNQRLVVRLKKRTSFKTHSSSGLAESDWRAIPPKTIKLLFPGVTERGGKAVGVSLRAKAVAEDWELTSVRTVEIPGSGLIRIRGLRDLFPSECLDIEHVNVGNHPTLCNEAASLGGERSERWVDVA